MECEIKKEVLKKALATIKKVAGRPALLALKCDPKKGSLSLITSSDLFCCYNIAAKGVVAGEIILDFDRVEKLLNSRKDKIKFKKKDKALHIDSGTKAVIYCSEHKIKTKEPELDGKVKKIKIKSKQVGLLKKTLELLKFNIITPGTEVIGVPTILKNTDDGFIFATADPVHCLFFTYPGTLSKKSFELVFNLTTIKNVFSAIDTEVEVFANKKVIQVRSPQLVVSMPTLQVGTDAIKRAEGFITDTSLFSKKYAKMRTKDLQGVLESVKVVEQQKEPDNLLMSLNKKDNRINFSLTTKFGSANDFFKFKGNMKSGQFRLPIMHLRDVLSSFNSSETLRLQLSKNENYYKLTSQKGKISIVGIAPCFQNS